MKTGSHRIVGRARATELQIPAGDGRLLGATIFAPAEPSGQEHPVTVLASATGVKRGFYDAYALFLAEAGLHVITFDYRGIGGSRSGALGSFRATAREAILMRDGLMPRMPGKFAPAEVGEVVPISITQYCDRGETRRGRYVRPGIVAADPRIFPLARYVEVFLGDRYLGRYLVDDTGGNVLGATLDMWTPSCNEAQRFGRRSGKAILVARESEYAPPPADPVRWDGIAKR